MALIGTAVTSIVKAVTGLTLIKIDDCCLPLNNNQTITKITTNNDTNNASTSIVGSVNSHVN
jgi:hypothetical protein